MLKKSFLILLSVVTLGACTHRSEIVYNEQVASLYTVVSRDFEFCHQKFLDGGYKTQFERGGEKDQGFGVESLRNQVVSCQSVFDLLQPGTRAEEFHDLLKSYFSLVGEDYANALQAYCDLDCECPAVKDSLAQQIKTLYSRISDVEDQSLEVQKKFIQAVGGTPKE